MWGEDDVHTSAWNLKRQYMVCNFGLKAEIHWSLKRRERSAGRSSDGEKRPTGHSSISVSSPAVSLLHKMGCRHRRKICAKSPRLYSYYTQSSTSKYKNINYIYIYLRVFRCLTSGSNMRQLHPVIRFQFKSSGECGLTLSSPFIPGPLWPRIVAPICVLL